MRRVGDHELLADYDELAANRINDRRGISRRDRGNFRHLFCQLDVAGAIAGEAVEPVGLAVAAPEYGRVVRREREP